MRMALGRLLAVALCAGLCACGGGGANVDETPPPTPSSSIVDLGVVSLTATNQGQTFEVIVDGVSALVIVADGGDATDIDIDLLETPSGRLLVTPSRGDANPLTGATSPQEVGGSVATAVLTGSPTDPIEPGVYTFRIASFDEAGVRNSARVVLTAIMNRRANLVTGMLPVNVYLVGTPGLNAATAPTSEALSVVMREIVLMYGAIGIRVEVAQFKDIIADPAVRLGVLDVLDDTTDRLVADRNLNRQSDEMDELFALSSASANRALNLFLVQEFFTHSGRVALSGGRPGPSILQGTAHSGIAASVLGGLDSQSEGDLEDLGRNIALEMARYLGARPSDDQDEFTPAQATVLLYSPAVEGQPQRQ